MLTRNRNEAQGVHSLTDVPVFAMGPCQELFGGVYGNIDIFFNMANCLGLARPSNASGTISSGTNSSATAPFTGAAPVNGVQRGLWVGMLVFQMAICWVTFNM
jgi:hypothetical protein